MSSIVSIQEIEQVFFNAMLEGWATDAAKNGTAEYARRTSSPLFPGYKIIEWRKDDWLVIDSYGGRTDSPWSSGNTLIFFQDTPIWVMYYGGWYERGVIPFVKEVLATTYRSRQFFGGRGPERFTNNDTNLIYTNEISRNYFADFSGEEKVRNFGADIIRGYHEYRGFVLLPHQQ